VAILVQASDDFALTYNFQDTHIWAHRAVIFANSVIFLFEERRHNKNKNKKMSSDMGSVPDPKCVTKQSVQKRYMVFGVVATFNRCWDFQFAAVDALLGTQNE